MANSRSAMARRARRVAAALAAAAVTAALSASALAAPAAAQSADAHVVNMRDADISAFIEDVSAVTGYTFIVHPEVRGRVTVTSQTPLSREEVFQVFLSTLRVQGYTAIPTSNGAYRIVPESAGAVDGSSVGTGGEPLDQFITEVIQLRHFPANEAARMVTPLVNHRGQVTANAANNVLIVVDYAGNIGRIREIITELDEDRSIVSTVALENASAREVAAVVNALSTNSGDTRSATVSAVALDSSNAIVLRGDDIEVARARNLVEDLDVSSRPAENLRVVSLQHAQAAEVVPILEAVARRLAPASEEGFTIPFDEATNSIILAADAQTVNALQRVIDELDVRRAQVLVEAIIVEISDNVAHELGVQFLLAGDDNSSVPFAVTNFSRSAPNLLAITGALTVNEGEDDSGNADYLQELAVSSLLGLEGFGLGIGGQNDDGLFGVILNAVDADADSNILSTPSIMTLDNQPASIIVGQEVPITTGEALSASNSNPFRTIERQDVGVQLEVRPQINEGDSIQLQIRQEVSSVAGVVSNTFEELLLNTREIETTVIADDGEIIVLGGLIDNTETTSDSRVPVLGDIPVVGRAFSSRGRTQARRNLMVFIRPTIVRDIETGRALAAERYQGLVEDGALRAHGAAISFDDLLRDALGDLSTDE